MNGSVVLFTSRATLRVATRSQRQLVAAPARSFGKFERKNCCLSKINFLIQFLNFLIQTFSHVVAAGASALPESLTRIGTSEIFPNEYPGQNYAFNWSLNGDGITPLKKSAFRLTKALDLKIAGLAQSSSSQVSQY